MKELIIIAALIAMCTIAASGARYLGAGFAEQERAFFEAEIQQEAEHNIREADRIRRSQ